MKTIILMTIIVILNGCVLTENNHALTPMQAIEASAAKAPHALDGEFELMVKSTKNKHQMQFLNSEQDERDQRNLVIALRPNAVKELKALNGSEPDEYYLGKKIKIKGQAQTIKHWVLYKNKNIKEYYYQTQVFVKSADQVTVL